MKNTLFLLLFLVGCLAAPAVKYEPTTNVTVYKDLGSIPRAYLLMWELEMEGQNTTQEALLRAMIEKAKTHGADGLIKVKIFPLSEMWINTRPVFETYPGGNYGDWDVSSTRKDYIVGKATMIRFK